MIMSIGLFRCEWEQQVGTKYPLVHGNDPSASSQNNNININMTEFVKITSN